MKRIRLTQRQIARLGGLLWMKYKPSEIAGEIKCSVDTIYKSYIPAGCPHERDATGSIWIVGTEFAEWARKVIVKHKRKTDMRRDQAWCLKCRAVVDVLGLTSKPFQQHLERIGGKCAVCGMQVYRTRTK